MDRLLRHFPGLVRHGTIPVAVDVPVLVAAADDVVTALSEDRACGPPQHLLALLVPEEIRSEESIAKTASPLRAIRSSASGRWAWLGLGP